MKEFQLLYAGPEGTDGAVVEFRPIYEVTGVIYRGTADEDIKVGIDHRLPSTLANVLQ